MRVRNASTGSEWLKWLTLIAVIAASIAIVVASVNLSPAASQAGQVDAEVLATQLEFILKMNSAFLAFLGIIGALLTWFFKNNLEDAKAVAAKMVREELDQHIQARVQEEFRYWEMSAQMERVVGQTLVAYYLPNGSSEPREFSLVKRRKFRQVLFCSRIEEVRHSSADVVIFDIQNWKTPVAERVVHLNNREEMIREHIDSLRAVLPDNIVLVIYIRGTVNYLYDPKFENSYVLPANNQVTMLGHAVSGAYVAYGDRLSNNS